MRNFKKITLLFLFPVLFFQIGNAQIEVKATIDSTYLLIGQQTMIHLEVVQPQEAKVNFPNFMPEESLADNVEIISISKPDTAKIDGGKIRINQDYLVTSFDSGNYVIPPFKFLLVDREFKTNSLALNVENIQVDTEQNFKDIKPVYRPPFDWLFWLGITGAVLAGLALIGFGIYYFLKWKKNRQVQIFEEPEAIVPPHEIALQKLTQIREEKIWQKGQDKLFYTQITDVLREYFTKRFNIQAMEMTSSEILDAMQMEKEAQDILAKLKSILYTSDMAKFAKRQPTVDENEASMANAFFVVNQTIKKEEMSDEVISKFEEL